VRHTDKIEAHISNWPSVLGSPGNPDKDKYDRIQLIMPKK
jgi:hypothetical protein